MKTQKIIGVLIGALLISSPIAIHNASGHQALAKNKLVTASITNVGENSKESAKKKVTTIGKTKAMNIAVTTLSDWYSVTTQPNELKCKYIIQKNDNGDEQPVYLITNSKRTISVTIEASSGRVLYLESGKADIKGTSDAKYTLDEASKIAADFIDKHSLTDGQEVTFDKDDSETSSKDQRIFYLYFNYDNGAKQIMISVNKSDGEVVGHFLISDTFSVG